MKVDEAKTGSAFLIRVRKYALWILGVFVLYGIFGFFVFPGLVKQFVLTRLSESLHRPVAIRRVAINPLSLSLVMEGLEIRGREEEAEIFAAFDGLYLNLQLSSLWRRGPVIDEIRLVNPRIRFARLAENRYNFSDLIAPKEEESAEKIEKAKDAKLAFSLNNIQVSGGHFEFDDRVIGEKYVASDLALRLPFFSSMAYATEIFVEPHFSAILDGAPIEIKGQSKPFSASRESEFKLVLRQVPLPKFFAYFPTGMPVLLKSGALDTDLTFVFDLARGLKPRMTFSGTAAVRDLEMSEANGSLLLKLARLDLALAADPFGGKYQIERLSLDAPEVAVRADRAGKIVWRDFLPKTKSARDAPALNWSLAEGIIRGGRLRWSDASLAKGAPIDFETIEALVRNLDGKGGMADFGMTFALKGQEKHAGEVKISGKLGIAPFEADFGLNARTVDLLPWQPYFSGMLNLDLKRGQVSANGQAQLRRLTSQGTMTGGFSGELTIGNFLSLDKARSDFLRWKSLHLGGIDARFGPGSVAISDIALSDFFARLIVSPEGRLNLFDIARQEAATSTEAGPALPLSIDRITLQGGSVHFTDHFIKPNYSARLGEIGGRLSGLSSAPETQASLELRGQYDRVAPLKILARINPLSAQPYLDLQAEVQGVDLTALSAYSGKYAGYAIDKGKLSLFVKYKIENRQLEAENRLFLDQLSFGGAVESADATTLPVRLAVSLLKNRKGEIDINLPVSGSLDDPQFSVGGLILRMLVNLLTKAAISPFALIGSMLGGEELDDVAFDPGRATLTPEATERLEKLAGALIERPGLKFEIEGRADPDQDTEGLKRARLERKIRVIKRGEGEDDAPQVFTAEEYPGLLARVYAEEDFPKPRNMIGFVKTLPVEEMEKLILAHTRVGEDDLKMLADRRAKAVRDWLIAREVDAGRIFLLPSKVGIAEEGKPASGASFSLK